MLIIPVIFIMACAIAAATLTLIAGDAVIAGLLWAMVWAFAFGLGVLFSKTPQTDDPYAETTKKRALNDGIQHKDESGVA